MGFTGERWSGRTVVSSTWRAMAPRLSATNDQSRIQQTQNTRAPGQRFLRDRDG